MCKDELNFANKVEKIISEYIKREGYQDTYYPWHTSVIALPYLGHIANLASLPAAYPEGDLRIMNNAAHLSDVQPVQQSAAHEKAVKCLR